MPAKARQRDRVLEGSALDWLLDPDVPSVTLLTIERAARVLGKKLEVRMV